MKFVIANWKMNLSVEEGIALAKEYLRVFKETPAEVIACPSFTSLPFVGKILGDSAISVGAQDVFWETEGAFTGEVSVGDLRDLGAGYVIVGHSERRAMGETDWMINRKIHTILNTEPLCPILCIGERSDDRVTGQLEAVLSRQLTEALAGVELKGRNLIVAYEPIWSIGTGTTPTNDEIEYVMEMIRVILRKQLGREADEACAVVYGGSVNPETAKEIASLPILDGFLVGGASLNAKEFYRIAQTVVD